MSMLDILNTRMTELDALQKLLEERLGAPHRDDFQRGMHAGRLIQVHEERAKYQQLFAVLLPE